MDLFTEAVRLPVEERAAFLATACGGDAELRGNVEALLQAHARSGGFLEQAPDEIKDQVRAPGEKPGDRVGRYKLLEQIGEGGCGVVFMAEQEEPMRRRVALKVIKPGMDTKNVIARFEAERQALAMMDHPNIAHVFDAGAMENGRPYFVMELVRGSRITEYCDQHSLKTAERLEIFIEVCGAVQYAHQKGIIHRDLKPSNILVTASETGTPLPKIIDFGIAKATNSVRLTDKTVFTAMEMLIGTPAYMSPEQAALSSVDVDTRSDIYSLGVLLYELLTGTTPFDTSELLKEGLDQVRRVIREREPVRPSTRLVTMGAGNLTTVSKRRQTEPPKLIREVRGDLDWMVMMAIEKDRARRYPTANALATDAQRYLSGEAIMARPPSAWYKFTKLASRNKLLFCGMGIIFVLLTAGLTITSLLLSRATQEAEVIRMEAHADELDRAGKADDALPIHRKAVAMRRKLFGADEAPPANCFYYMVEGLTRRNLFDEAESVMSQFLTPAALEKSNCVDLVRLRGNTYARHGKWREALADYERALEFRPTEAQNFHAVATLLVATTNWEGYRQICPRIVERFRNTMDPGTADQMAKDCLARAPSGADLRAVGAMAGLAVTAGKEMNVYPFFQCCKALADYRQGDWNDAVNWATNAAVNPYAYTRGEAWAILAMAQRRLGQTNDARSTLARCERLIEKQIPAFGQDLGGDWRDWIVLHALQKEAEELVNAPETPADASAGK